MNLLTLSGLVGALLPPGIALVNQQHWSARVKSAVAFVICLAAAFVIVWAKGQIDWHDYAKSAGLVFVLARTTYAGVWRPTRVAPAIEAATTPKSSP